MKLHQLGILSLTIFTCLYSCKENVEIEEEEITSEEMNSITYVDTTYKFKYQKSLDPLIAGESFVDQIFVDTLLVQMYKTTIKPGDSASLHQHPDHTVYVLKGGTLRLSFNGGDPIEMEFQEGAGFMSGPASDYAVNIGDTEVSFLMHEIYRPRGSAKNLEEVDY